MRWIWLLAALACAALFFVIDSPGLLALDILGLFVFGTLAVFAFVAARIDDTARSALTILTPADLATIRARAAPRGAAVVASGGQTAGVGDPDAAVESSIDALRARAEARRRAVRTDGA